MDKFENLESIKRTVVDYLNKLSRRKRKGVIIIVISLLAPPILRLLFMSSNLLNYIDIPIRIASWIGVIYGIILFLKKNNSNDNSPVFKIPGAKQEEKEDKSEQEPNGPIHIN